LKTGKQVGWLRRWRVIHGFRQSWAGNPKAVITLHVADRGIGERLQMIVSPKRASDSLPRLDSVKRRIRFQEVRIVPGCV
jgi:hypothetical protein